MTSKWRTQNLTRCNDLLLKSLLKCETVAGWDWFSRVSDHNFWKEIGQMSDQAETEGNVCRVEIWFTNLPGVWGQTLRVSEEASWRVTSLVNLRAFQNLSRPIWRNPPLLLKLIIVILTLKTKTKSKSKMVFKN